MAVSQALWNVLSCCILLEKSLFTGGACIFWGIHHSWLKGILFALTCFSWWTNEQKTVHRSQCLWLPVMGNGPEFLMPYWIRSQYTAQYVKHSFCWWIGDLVSWNGKIYFTKDRRCWTSNKIPPGAGVGGGSNLTYILEAFILCPLNITWIETGLNFPNFFIGNSVSLPPLQCLAMELVTRVHNMLRCLDFFLLMFP